MSIPSKTNPEHYERYPDPVHEMARKLFGDEAVYWHCIVSAFEYRMRMGCKPGETFEDDFEKEKWRLDKAKKLDAK